MKITQFPASLGIMHHAFIANPESDKFCHFPASAMFIARPIKFLLIVFGKVVIHFPFGHYIKCVMDLKICGCHGNAFPIRAKSCISPR